VTLEDTHTVTEKDICPSGRPGHCCHCKSKVGEHHEPECPHFQKTVIARVSFDVLLRVPNYWEKEDAEFCWNESSSCKSNLLWAINKQAESLDGCPCDFAEAEMLRDATIEDHILADPKSARTLVANPSEVAN
jgi:hypothetical protein